MSRRISRAIVQLRVSHEISIEELCAHFQTDKQTWHRIENEYTDSPHLQRIYDSILKYILHRRQKVQDDT